MDSISTLISVPAPTLAHSGKADLLAYADTLVTTYHEEGHDLLTLLAEAAKLELLATEIKSKAKRLAVNEVSQYGREGVSKLGVYMTVKPVGTVYDYTADPVWQRLNQVVEQADAQLSAHEKLLKALPYEGRLMTDDDSGEIYKAYPPAKSGGDGVVLTIK